MGRMDGWGGSFLNFLAYTCAHVYNKVRWYAKTFKKLPPHLPHLPHLRHCIAGYCIVQSDKVTVETVTVTTVTIRPQA